MPTPEYVDSVERSGQQKDFVGGPHVFDVDDLVPCLKHHVKLNRCSMCWPEFLTHLGSLCIQYYAFRKQMQINVLGRPA